MSGHHQIRKLGILSILTVMTASHGFQFAASKGRNGIIMLYSERGEEEYSMDALKLEQFRRRKGTVERKAFQNRWNRPPNPLLGPVDLIECLLEELRSPTSQYSGVTALLEASTEAWRDMLRRSVGGPMSASNDQIAPPLEAALGRPNNQFAILLGVEDVNFRATFPTDPLDYGDTCWVECRLRSAPYDELLVATGWSLEKASTDGSWLVAALDWQDFREAYRPGIGREEWERICG